MSTTPVAGRVAAVFARPTATPPDEQEPPSAALAAWGYLSDARLGAAARQARAHVVEPAVAALFA